MDYAWLLFSFKGRTNRARYLIVQCVLLAIWLLLWLKSPWQQWQVLHWVIAAAMIWVDTATTVKRLHDRNRNGWWAVAVVIVNRLSYLYYGLFFGLHFGFDRSIAWELLVVMFAVAMSLLQTWIVIELFFLIGTDGRNRFGPDPTRHVPSFPINSRPQPAGVPDFLVSRGGAAPRR